MSTMNGSPYTILSEATKAFKRGDTVEGQHQLIKLITAYENGQEIARELFGAALQSRDQKVQQSAQQLLQQRINELSQTQYRVDSECRTFQSQLEAYEKMNGKLVVYEALMHEIEMSYGDSLADIEVEQLQQIAQNVENLSAEIEQVQRELDTLNSDIAHKQAELVNVFIEEGC